MDFARLRCRGWQKKQLCSWDKVLYTTKCWWPDNIHKTLSFQRGSGRPFDAQRHSSSRLTSPPVRHSTHKQLKFWKYLPIINQQKCSGLLLIFIFSAIQPDKSIFLAFRFKVFKLCLREIVMISTTAGPHKGRIACDYASLYAGEILFLGQSTEHRRRERKGRGSRWNSLTATPPDSEPCLHSPNISLSFIVLTFFKSRYGKRTLHRRRIHQRSFY